MELFLRLTHKAQTRLTILLEKILNLKITLTAFKCGDRQQNTKNTHIIVKSICSSLFSESNMCLCQLIIFWIFLKSTIFA